MYIAHKSSYNNSHFDPHWLGCSAIMFVLGSALALIAISVAFSAHDPDYLIMSGGNIYNLYLIETDNGNIVAEDLLDVSNVTGTYRQSLRGVGLVCLKFIFKCILLIYNIKLKLLIL